MKLDKRFSKKQTVQQYMCASRAPQASVQRWASESQDEEHSITPTATSLRLHHQSGPYGGGDRDIYERRICTHAHAAAIIVIYGTLDAEMEPSRSSPSHFRPRPRPLEVLL